MTITVIAHPNSKKPRILEREPGVFDVYVAESAVDGKANNAIIKSLANYYKVSQSQVAMKSGLKSKTKRYTIG